MLNFQKIWHFFDCLFSKNYSKQSLIFLRKFPVFSYNFCLIFLQNSIYNVQRHKFIIIFHLTSIWCATEKFEIFTTTIKVSEKIFSDFISLQYRIAKREEMIFCIFKTKRQKNLSTFSNFPYHFSETARYQFTSGARCTLVVIFNTLRSGLQKKS